MREESTESIQKILIVASSRISSLEEEEKKQLRVHRGTQLMAMCDVSVVTWYAFFLPSAFFPSVFFCFFLSLLSLSLFLFLSGMGFPTLATKGLKPFMQAALEQKVVKRWMFAFYLCRFSFSSCLLFHRFWTFMKKDSRFLLESFIQRKRKEEGSDRCHCTSEKVTWFFNYVWEREEESYLRRRIFFSLDQCISFVCQSF